MVRVRVGAEGVADGWGVHGVRRLRGRGAHGCCCGCRRGQGWLAGTLSGCADPHDGRVSGRTRDAVPVRSSAPLPQVSGSKRLVSRMAAPEPSPACMVCGTATAQVSLDTGRWTLQQLVDKAS